MVGREAEILIDYWGGAIVGGAPICMPMPDLLQWKAPAKAVGPTANGSACAAKLLLRS